MTKMAGSGASLACRGAEHASFRPELRVATWDILSRQRCSSCFISWLQHSSGMWDKEAVIVLQTSQSRTAAQTLSLQQSCECRMIWAHANLSSENIRLNRQ